jgi:hypothetical protein
VDRAGPTETHAFYLSTRHLPKKFIIKNFTLNDSKFEKFAKERQRARAIAVKPRHPNRASAVEVRDLKSALLPVRAT